MDSTTSPGKRVPNTTASKHTTGSVTPVEILVNCVSRSLRVTPRKAAALLGTQRNVFAHILRNGIQGEFQYVEKLMVDLVRCARRLSVLLFNHKKRTARSQANRHLESNNEALNWFLSLMRPGLVSESANIARLTCTLLSRLAVDLVNHSGWQKDFWSWFSSNHNEAIMCCCLAKHPHLRVEVFSLFDLCCRIHYDKVFENLLLSGAGTGSNPRPDAHASLPALLREVGRPESLRLSFALEMLALAAQGRATRRALEGAALSNICAGFLARVPQLRGHVHPDDVVLVLRGLVEVWEEFPSDLSAKFWSGTLTAFHRALGSPVLRVRVFAVSLLADLLQVVGNPEWDAMIQYSSHMPSFETSVNPIAITTAPRPRRYSEPSVLRTDARKVPEHWDVPLGLLSGKDTLQSRQEQLMSLLVHPLTEDSRTARVGHLDHSHDAVRHLIRYNLVYLIDSFPELPFAQLLNQKQSVSRKLMKNMTKYDHSADLVWLSKISRLPALTSAATDDSLEEVVAAADLHAGTRTVGGRDPRRLKGSQEANADTGSNGRNTTIVQDETVQEVSDTAGDVLGNVLDTAIIACLTESGIRSLSWAELLLEICTEHDDRPSVLGRWVRFVVLLFQMCVESRKWISMATKVTKVSDNKPKHSFRNSNIVCQQDRHTGDKDVSNENLNESPTDPQFRRVSDSLIKLVKLVCGSPSLVLERLTGKVFVLFGIRDFQRMMNVPSTQTGYPIWWRRLRPFDMRKGVTVVTKGQHESTTDRALNLIVSSTLGLVTPIHVGSLSTGQVLKGAQLLPGITQQPRSSTDQAKLPNKDTAKNRLLNSGGDGTNRDLFVSPWRDAFCLLHNYFASSTAHLPTGGTFDENRTISQQIGSQGWLKLFRFIHLHGCTDEPPLELHNRAIALMEGSAGTETTLLALHAAVSTFTPPWIKRSVQRSREYKANDRKLAPIETAKLLVTTCYLAILQRYLVSTVRQVRLEKILYAFEECDEAFNIAQSDKSASDGKHKTYIAPGHWGSGNCSTEGLGRAPQTTSLVSRAPEDWLMELGLEPQVALVPGRLARFSAVGDSRVIATECLDWICRTALGVGFLPFSEIDTIGLYGQSDRHRHRWTYQVVQRCVLGSPKSKHSTGRKPVRAISPKNSSKMHQLKQRNQAASRSPIHAGNKIKPKETKLLRMSETAMAVFLSRVSRPKYKKPKHSESKHQRKENQLAKSIAKEQARRARHSKLRKLLVNAPIGNNLQVETSTTNTGRADEHSPATLDVPVNHNTSVVVIPKCLGDDEHLKQKSRKKKRRKKSNRMPALKTLALNPLCDMYQVPLTAQHKVHVESLKLKYTVLNETMVDETTVHLVGKEVGADTSNIAKTSEGVKKVDKVNDGVENDIVKDKHLAEKGIVKDKHLVEKGNGKHTIENDSAKDKVTIENDNNAKEEHSIENDNNAKEKHSIENDNNAKEKHTIENDNNAKEMHSIENDNNAKEKHTIENDSAKEKHTIENDSAKEKHTLENDSEKEKHTIENDNSAKEKHTIENDNSAKEKHTLENDNSAKEKHTIENDNNAKEEHKKENDSAKKEHKKENDNSAKEKHTIENDNNAKEEHKKENGKHDESDTLLQNHDKVIVSKIPGIHPESKQTSDPRDMKTSDVAKVEEKPKAKVRKSRFRFGRKR